MIVRLLSLVFCSFWNCNFQLVVASIIRKRCVIDKVTYLRKFVKLDNKIHKNEADIEFLKMFLNFKLANNNMRYSETHKQCQTYSLTKKSKQRHPLLLDKKRTLNMFRKFLKRKFDSKFDFVHISCVFSRKW